MNWLAALGKSRGIVRKPLGRDKEAIYPKTPTTFVLKNLPIEVEFIKDKEGKVVMMILNERGNKTEPKGYNNYRGFEPACYRHRLGYIYNFDGAGSYCANKKHLSILYTLTISGDL